MKKLQVGRRLLAFLLVLILCLEHQSFVNAAESVQSNQILTTEDPIIETSEEGYFEEGVSEEAIFQNNVFEENAPEVTPEVIMEEATSEEVVIDEETGLKMQTIVLDSMDAAEEVPFDMEAHMALGNKNTVPTYMSSTVTETTEGTLVSNDYIEFAINAETGRFTIGTVEGNSNYTSDNNQLLVFGHPYSTTSFTTVQINGVNYLFSADETTYDASNNRAVSVMDVAGVRVIQTLEIVESESTGLEDTVRINYSVLNKSTSSKNVGVRIMIDTMLGSNDGAPFKIPAAGSITKEREFVGSEVPAYWQAFDSLSSPSVFAVGTIHRNTQMRKPDKVQYASWGNIYGTSWDYEINTDRYVTNDSAVAFYWNPISVPAGASTSVETYYGTSLSTNSGQVAEPVEIDLKDKYVVLVTQNGGSDVLAGATVKIDGVGTATTDENGNAVFESNLPAEGYASRKKITVSCDGYQTKEVYRLVEKTSCSAMVMETDDGTPYIKSISLTGMNSGSFADYVDLTSQNFTIEEDSADTETYYEILITATGNGNGNVNRYKIIQNNEVIEQEDVTTDSRTIRLMKSKLKAGYRIYVQVETDGGESSEKEQTTLLVNKKISILGEDTKETKGTVNLGGSGIKFKIPDDAVAFGGMELNMDLPGLPIEFEASDDGTVKVAVGLDELGDDWEEKEKKWDEILAKYERGDNIQSVFNNYEGTTSWNVAGGFKPSFVGVGYAEGKIDEFGNCKVDLIMILGVQGEYTYSQQYIVGYVPLGFEFKTGVKGTYTAGGTVTIGESSTGKLNVDFQGNKGKLDIDIYASLYGGLGLVGVLTVGGEGEAHLLLGYDIQQQYYDAKVKGSLALTARAFMFSAKYTIAEKTWNISSGYITENGGNSSRSMYDVLYDASSYSMMSRQYLSAEPIRQYAAASTEDFLQNVYPASEPQMVLVDGTPYLFWLMDDIFRDEANRTVLVYSKYENGWSEPVAVEDDATADFSFDVIAEGNNIHIIWQDMATVFAGSAWDAMSDEDKLLTMSAGSDISYACMDTANDSVAVAGIVTNNNQADMLPQLTLQDGKVYAAWYTNTENDILTQKGTNVISVAEISSASAVNLLSESDTAVEVAVTVSEENAETVSDNNSADETVSGSDLAEAAVSGNDAAEDTPVETAQAGVPEYLSSAYSANVTRVAELEDVPVASIALGSLNDKLTVAYVLDDDKDLTTVADHDLYVYDVESQQILYTTEDEVCDANPQFAQDGSGLYWYADKQLYYITENAAASTVNAVLSESATAATENFLVLDDNSIIWTASSVSEEGETLYEIYRSERVSGIFSEPYKLVAGQQNSIGDITACTDDESTHIAYVINYIEQDVSDIVYEEITAVTDLTLDNIEIDYTSVQPGAATDYVASVTNTGSTDVSKVTVTIYNYYTGEQTSFTQDVNVPKGTSADLELSHLFYGEDLEGVQEYLFEVSASGEADDRLGDNSEYAYVGYTDVSLTSSTYYADDSYYTNLVVENHTGVPAENSVLRIYADEQEGAILYEKYLGTIEAYKTYAVQLDLFDLAGNSAVEELHIALSTDTADYIEGNNEEIEYLHFLWREEESYPLTLRVMKSDEIYEEKVIGNYRAGDIIQVEADSFQGYDFIGWTTAGNGYFYDTANTLTYFNMPEEETVILASYIPNAFRELEKTIVVGESLLISPVYDGVWMDSDRYGVTKAAYDGNIVKVTGVSEGTVQYKFVGSNGEEAQIITINVCSIAEVNIISEYMENGTLKLRPYEVENLEVQGTKQDGTVMDLPNVTWSIKSSKVATLANNVITGKTKGKTVLEGKIGTCTLSVPVEVYVPVTGIYVSNPKGNNYTPIQTTLKLKASVYGYGGLKPNNSKIVWSSSDTSVATVDSKGKVTAKSVGTVYIYANAADGSGVYGSYYLNVTNKVSYISKSNYSYLYGYVGYGSIYDHFTVYSTNGSSISDYAVTWKSSNPKVVSVTYGANIRAHKKGTAILTGTYGGKSVKIKVEVREYVNGVKISGKTQLAVGQSTKLTAKPTNSTAYNKNIYFSISSAYDSYGNSVSASQVATITSSGTLKATGKGYVYVKAQAADENGSYTTQKVVVSAPVKKLVWSDEFTGTQETEPGTGILIRAYAIDKDGDTMPVEISYKSSSKAATVGSSKTAYSTWIFAKKTGTATITASYGGKKITRKVKVTQPVEGVEITGDSTIIIGETKTYKAAFSPTTASVKKADWIIAKAYDADGNITDPTTIVTFNKGKLKALAEGKVVLRATSLDGSGEYALKTVEVIPAAEELKLSATKLSINIGDSADIIAELTGAESVQLNSRYITWKSSNAKVVSIENGQLQALKKGSATITATYGTKKATLKVTVTQPVEQIAITGSNTMTIGKANTLKASVLPKTVSNKKVTWEIVEAWDLLGNEVENVSEIATISSKGKITAAKTGTIIVRVTALDGSGSKAEQKVTIFGKPDSVEISGKNSLNVGDSTILTATVFDDAGICIENATVKWSSSNTKAVKVDKYGKITAVKAGKATIKATCGGKTATYEVIVE